MKVLLDTNILLTRPQVLASKKDGIDLVIPFPVRLEMAISSLTRTESSKISQLVDDAVKAGNAQIGKLRTIPSLEETTSLSGTDIEIITLAQELTAEGDKVVIATQDMRLIAGATQLGLECVRLDKLEELLSDSSSIDQSIDIRAKTLLASQRRTLLLGVLIGGLASLGANALWTYSNEIVATIPVWGTVLSILFLGFAAYALRGRFKFTYGVFEFVFGVMLAVRVFWPDFSYEEMQAAELLQVVAGMYVMVRGQANIGKALQPTRFAPYWERLSGER